MPDTSMGRPKTEFPPSDETLLAIDLDGALIPRPDGPPNQADLGILAAAVDRPGLQLVYVTGREFASVTDAISQFGLPQPDWLICEAGTAILGQRPPGQFAAIPEYRQDTEATPAFALAWLIAAAGRTSDAVVYAGNDDVEALTAGYRTILVGNADRSVARRVYGFHRKAEWGNRLFLANGPAARGVLQGRRWFGLVEPTAVTEKPGATPVNHETTHFRVWAPRCQSVTVEVGVAESSQRYELGRQSGGCFAGDVSPAGPGTLYQFVLNEEGAFPDPRTNFQPAGVHGPSQIIDHRLFPWTDQDWLGVRKRDLVIYELHVGSFTTEGTFQAAMERIDDLLELGVTAVELMPVAQSPGRWNWGYDGVDLFAARNTYGEPDDLKALVDACHAAGLAVILDVVYNHLGPEGNYLAPFGPYFSGKHQTPWGEAFNFDDTESEQVRRFIVDNAIFWLETYHLDGLRLDAVHFIQDDSDVTMLDEIRLAVADFASSAERTVHLIAESNVYDEVLLNERGGRPAYDAIWCDCIMHSIYTHALPDLQLSHREYKGTRDLVQALDQGHVFAGPKKSRVSPGGDTSRQLGYDRQHVASLVVGLQTHDAVGNHPQGKRIHQLTSKAFQKAAVALTMLYPSIPLIFMGEEFASESPFPFFVDFEDPRLQRAVDEGRAKEYPQHIWGNVLRPTDAQTFQLAKCQRSGSADEELFQWYRDLIAFRKQGIAEGWLAVDRMSSSYQAEHDLFTLRFEVAQRGQVTVHSRLASASRAPLATVSLAGTLVLSSEPDPPFDGEHVSISRNHAVISRS